MDFGESGSSAPPDQSAGHFQVMRQQMHIYVRLVYHRAVFYSISNSCDERLLVACAGAALICPLNLAFVCLSCWLFRFLGVWTRLLVSQPHHCILDTVKLGAFELY